MICKPDNYCKFRQFGIKKPNNLAQPWLVLIKLKHTKQNTLTCTDKHEKQVKNRKLKKMAYL